MDTSEMRKWKQPLRTRLGTPGTPFPAVAYRLRIISSITRERIRARGTKNVRMAENAYLTDVDGDDFTHSVLVNLQGEASKNAILKSTAWWPRTSYLRSADRFFPRPTPADTGLFPCEPRPLGNPGTT